MPTPRPICPITGKPLHHNQTIHPHAATQYRQALEIITYLNNDPTPTPPPQSPTRTPAHAPAAPLNLNTLILLQAHTPLVSTLAILWHRHTNPNTTPQTRPLANALKTLATNLDQFTTWEYAPQTAGTLIRIALRLLAATTPRAGRALTICACPNCQTTYTTPTPQNPHATTHCPNCQHAAPLDEASQTAITLALTKPLPIQAAAQGLALINPESHIGKAAIYKAIQKDQIPHTESKDRLLVTIQALIDYLGAHGHKN